MFLTGIVCGMIGLSPLALADANMDARPTSRRILYDQYYKIEDSAAVQPPVPLAIDSFMSFTAATPGEDLLRWARKNLSWPEPSKPYDRASQFGAWTGDPGDRPCLNTREKVLIRDSERTVDFGADGCKIKSGEWLDPYSGKTFSKPTDIQIDHLVALKNAYINGAAKWSAKARCAYTNFMANPFHLVSASGHENQSKGDKDPSDWLPPNTAYHCSYLRNWLAVKMIWGLVMSQKETEAIKKQLLDNNCDLRKFRMSKAELTKQRTAISAALDLCP